MAEGDDARRMYYEGRLTSFAPDEGIALSHLAAEARQQRGRIPWSDATRTVDAAGIGTNGRELLNAAIRKGVVAVVEGTTDLVFPNSTVDGASGKPHRTQLTCRRFGKHGAEAQRHPH